MKYIKKVLFLTIILIAVSISKVFATAGTVTTDGVRVRKEPNTKSAIITILNKSAPVEIIEETNGWYKIKYTITGPYEGYMRKDFIKAKGEVTITTPTTEPTTPPVINETNPPVETQTPEITPSPVEIQTPETTSSPLETQTPEVTPLPQEEEPKVDLLGEKIISNDSKVYILPVITSSIKDTVSKDTEVLVQEVAGNFAYINYNNKFGWIRTNLLQEKSTDTKQKTTSRGSEPRQEQIIEQVKQETPTEKQTVETPIPKEESKVQDTPKTNSIGEQMAQMAKSYLGYKYVYGGANPSTGFDCSGFVYYICGQLGYSVNRTADSQVYNGVAVEKSNLRPGDLVFFSNYKTYKGIGHVGIYIGNNQFVHASTSTTGVITSSLDDALYVKRYVTARRIGV